MQMQQRSPSSSGTSSRLLACVWLLLALLPLADSAYRMQSQPAQSVQKSKEQFAELFKKYLILTDDVRGKKNFGAEAEILEDFAERGVGMRMQRKQTQMIFLCLLLQMDVTSVSTFKFGSAMRDCLDSVRENGQLPNN